ncbi:unnamed protein product [Acanthosepion pharaonis]|uniref:RING-type domain-containing protein n=1 Tax=Acanthosepion pharaonis TaxID=158019 RepID=A0A812DGR2_ACAPH|nr:unnamed protein product [Sepia pharaonis]
MASNVNDEETFQCSKCDQYLNWTSKTLPCLHSFCESCVLEGNGLCPQCQKPVTGDDLRLAPFLVKSLRRRELESSEWRCDWCFEDGMESSGQIWCHECVKLLCQNCNRGHKKSQRTHHWEDLSGKERVEAIRLITTDDCRRHRQSKDAFCQRCNVCLCDSCYKDHVTASPQCPPRPLSVREEASKGKEEGGPTLERELLQFEIQIRSTYAQTSRSIEQLTTDSESECLKLCQDFETFVKEARLKLAELCDNMKVMASELERKWRRSLKEREDLLKKVTIWRHTLRHLLTDDADDADVVCGLRLVRAELSARLHQSFAPPEKGRWLVTFPKWCHDSLDSLRKEMIEWAAETSGHLQMKSECRLQESNPLDLSSIVAGDEDSRIFVGDWSSGSIQEFSDRGEFVGQCPLTDGGKEFYPRDMCRVSKDILAVCGWQSEGFVCLCSFFLFLSFSFFFSPFSFSTFLCFFFSSFSFEESKGNNST